MNCITSCAFVSPEIQNAFLDFKPLTNNDVYILPTNGLYCITLPIFSFLHLKEVFCTRSLYNMVIFLIRTLPKVVELTEWDSFIIELCLFYLEYPEVKTQC